MREACARMRSGTGRAELERWESLVDDLNSVKIVDRERAVKRGRGGEERIKGGDWRGMIERRKDEGVLGGSV